MPEKTKPIKRKTTATKPVAIASKLAPAKAAVGAKPGKKIVEDKDKKTKKETGKVEVKVKVVRDSFTMPQNDYAKIAELKQACQKAGLQVKKSELLRAGLQVLSKLSMAQLKQTMAHLEHIKTGRPKKS